MEILTQEDDDAEEDRDDRPRTQTRRHDVLLVRAVPVDIALANFNPQVGGVGHGEVARVGDYNGQFVDSALEVADLEAHLREVTCKANREPKSLQQQVEGLRKCVYSKMKLTYQPSFRGD